MSKTEEKWVHPECLEGEVFLGNFTEREFYNQIPVGSKRLGKIVYTEDAKKFEGPEQEYLFPVFISQEDFDDLMQEVGQRMVAVEAITKGEYND